MDGPSGPPASKRLRAGFADNHAEYWQWKGPVPVSWFSGGYITEPAELQDLNRLQQTAPDVQ
jgi:hypothetical protein